MSNWDGKDRRQGNQMDLELRDKIISTHTNVQSIKEWTESHDKKDDKRFEDLAKDNRWRDKILYGGLGIVGFISFISHFLK